METEEDKQMALAALLLEEKINERVERIVFELFAGQPRFNFPVTPVERRLELMNRIVYELIISKPFVDAIAKKLAERMSRP